MPLDPGTRLGPYEIVGLLGTGGMGEVYRAQDPRLGRSVAIKILPASISDDSDRVRRFEREARAIASLNHPNICTIHDIGEHDGHRYLVMELMEGQPLNERLTAGAIPVPLLLDLAVQIADALDAAHGAGVVHRDLKPANIFVTKRGEAKLLDFGLAKLADVPDGTDPGATGITTPPAQSDAETIFRSPALTTVGTMLGTAAYMSPEQARGEPADAQSDLFSFGLVLYEMATGHVAFSGRTMAVLFDQILNRDPQPMEEIKPDLPAELSHIVGKAIEKDRELRYRSAADMRADLKRLKRDTPARRPALAPDVPAAPAPSRPPSSVSVPPEADENARAGAFVRRKRIRTWYVLAAIGLLFALRGVFNVFDDSPTDRGGSGRREISLQDVVVTQITSTGIAAQPSISADGKYVVYLQFEPEGNASVWLRQTAETSSVRVLGVEEGVRTLAATPGPDDSFIDVMRTNGIWRIPFLGGTPKLIVDRASSPVGWSPDGRSMAFIRPSPERRGQDLVVADADGSNQRIVTTSSGQTGGGFAINLPGQMAIAPAWSPDGERLAVFKRLSEDVRDIGIAVFDVEDGSETVVKAFGDVPFGAEWLDTRTLLVAQALEQGTPSQIWRISYPEGQRERLTNDVNRYAIVSLSADGNSLVTTRLESRVGLWVGEPHTSGRDVLNGLPFLSNAGQYATVSWDDANVLFTHTLNGRFEIFRMPPDGSGFPEAVVAGREMSAASDGTIVYRSLTGDDVGLWKVDRDGRRRVQLAKGTISYPLITHDGKEVVFSSAATGVQMLYRVPVSGGEPVPIVDEPVGIQSFSDVSPDGKSIAIVLPGESGRRQWNICDYPACTNRRPIEIPGIDVRWMPDGKGLTYVGADGMNLWTLPLDGSPPRELTRFSDGRPIQGYAWSHDGKRLAVSRLMSVTSDIVLFTGLRTGR